ncbi:MAG TPA: hypothetical protein VMM60_11835 [Ilumatobacter sp.]|nr:hypothetical protein [Ilumatobacter sp.]
MSSQNLIVGTVLMAGTAAGTAGTTTGTITLAATDDTRAVLAIVALLVVIAIGLAMLAVWLFRVTRPDRELLAPLEIMGARAWRRGDPVWQRRRLDEVRPADAAPASRAIAPPDLDDSYDAGPSAPGFDDFNEAPADATPDVPIGAVDAEHLMSAAEADDSAANADASPDDASPDDAGPDDVDSAHEPDADPADVDGVDAEAITVAVSDDVDVRDLVGADDDTAVDGVPSGIEPAISDDVSPTPPTGFTRSPFTASGPSADPDASLADLVAAADEPAGDDHGSGDGSDEPVGDPDEPVGSAD